MVTCSSLSTETTVSSGLSACNLVWERYLLCTNFLTPLPTHTLDRVGVGGWYRVGVGGWYRVGWGWVGHLGWVGGWYRIGVGG